MIPEQQTTGQVTGMEAREARFMVGQLISHKLFHYRGVIVDVDPYYMGSEEWYRDMAITRPPRNRPWYRVLVHNASHETYVAERNLRIDDSTDPVNHPLLETYFTDFCDGLYITHARSN
jgi:heat shock protein HspQ